MVLASMIPSLFLDKMLTQASDVMRYIRTLLNIIIVCSHTMTSVLLCSKKELETLEIVNILKYSNLENIRLSIHFLVI